MLTIPQELINTNFAAEDAVKLEQNTKTGTFTGVISKIEDFKGRQDRKYIEIKVSGEENNFMHYFSMTASSANYIAHLCEDLAVSAGLYYPAGGLKGVEILQFFNSLIGKTVRFEQYHKGEYLEIRFLAK